MHVVDGRHDVCLISDRHAGILAAIRELKESSFIKPPKWPDVDNK